MIIYICDLVGQSEPREPVISAMQHPDIGTAAAIVMGTHDEQVIGAVSVEVPGRRVIQTGSIVDLEAIGLDEAAGSSAGPRLERAAAPRGT